MKKTVSTIGAALLAVGLLSACDEVEEKPNESVSAPEPVENESGDIGEPDAEEAPAEEEPSEEPEAEPEVEPSDDVPTEHKNALRSANSYLETFPMSKAGLFDQLTSEYGGQFTEEAATYAVENVETDWKENALKSAQTYQDEMAMSPAAIRDQLVSEYGGQFTEEEADYAVNNLD